MTRMLTCRQVVAVLMDYVDGTLPAGTTRGVEAHLDICKPCRDFVAAYRVTPAVVRRATEPTTTAAAMRRLCRSAFRRQRPRS
jgi:anti-sigma factor RsiW